MTNYKKCLYLLIICFLIFPAGACSINPIFSIDWFQKSSAAEYESLMEKGRALGRQRHHQKAILLFDKAGVIESQRPEWLYEKARALFYMGQFSESITTCEQVLDRDPSFYDALLFGWAMRLEKEKSSEHIKKIVRNEIEDLVNSGKDETSVLMAALEGYQWLKDRDQEQKLIISLAQKAGSESRETSELISTRLFEQIVQEKEDKSARIALLEAYVNNFPRERYAAYAAFQLLKTRKEQAGDDFDAEKFAKILLNNVPNSHQLKTGAALWLIENDQNPEFAVHLLIETLVLTEQNPQKKPQFFKPDLWEKEIEKQKDKIHLLLGRAWFNAGNFDEASKAFYRVAEKKYPWGDVYYYLAKIALADGKKDEALENFCRSLEFGKRDDDAIEILTCLLSEEYGFEGNPAMYFSDIKNSSCFSDVTEAAGLGNVKAKRLAWGDYDQDGFDDLLLDGNLVFKNTGDGRFINTTSTSGLDRLKKTNGGIWGDYNNDGLLDIFITGRTENYLFENMGKGLFSDQTAILPDIAAPNANGSRCLGRPG